MAFCTLCLCRQVICTADGLLGRTAVFGNVPQPFFAVDLLENQCYAVMTALLGLISNAEIWQNVTRSCVAAAPFAVTVKRILAHPPLWRVPKA